MLEQRFGRWLPGWLRDRFMIVEALIEAAKNNSDEALRALAAALPAIAIPGAIIGGILFGFATPTESAAVASVVAFALGMLVYRELRLLLLRRLDV